MLIHNKDVTGFPCFLGHPVLYIYRYTSLEPSVALRVETDVPRQIKSPLTQLKISKSFFLLSIKIMNYDRTFKQPNSQLEITTLYTVLSTNDQTSDIYYIYISDIYTDLYLGFSTPVNCLFFVAMSINRSLEDNIKGRRLNLTL